MKTLNVDLGERSYPIFIGSGLFKDPDLLSQFFDKGRAVVVTNSVVAPLYLEKIKMFLGSHYDSAVILPDGEQYKNLDSVGLIYEHLLRGKYDRKTILIALGGGVVGDITGFAAATFQRGIRFIQIPTTILSLVDSSVGGKTGVNHSLGKNMIGSFHQPQCVIADMSVLGTLPKREIRAGFAEVLKYGLIGNADFFDWLIINNQALLGLDSELLSETVHICCRAKAEIVSADEKESGKRALLNLGHTFGHAIETATGYGKLLHGEAVATGMVMAADLSRRLGMLDSSAAAKIRNALENEFSFSIIPPASITANDYIDLMRSDKKAEQGKIKFILLEAIGSAVITQDVDENVLKETLTCGNRLCM